MMNVVDHHQREVAICRSPKRGAQASTKERAPVRCVSSGGYQSVDPDPTNRQRKLGQFVETDGRTNDRGIAAVERDQLPDEFQKKIFSHLAAAINISPD